MEQAVVAKRKKEKHGLGRIYAVNGRWYLRFMCRGQFHHLPLKAADGTPCTNKRAAQALRKSYIDAFKADATLAERKMESARQAGEKGIADAKRSKAGLLYVSQGFDLFRENRAGAGRLPGAATMRQYESIFSAFQDWQRNRKVPVTYLAAVTDDVADDYAEHLNRVRRLSARTYNGHISILRFIWKKIRKPAGLGERPNPWEDIELRKTDEGVRIGFTVEEARAIIAQSVSPAYRQAPGSLGVLAKNGELPTFFAIMAGTGFRMGDACLAKWENVKLEDNRIEIRARKTNRTHAIYLHPVLRRWLEALPGPREGYILPTLAELYGKSSYHVCVVAKRIFTDAGIVTNTEADESNVRRRVVHGCHSWRHSFATWATERHVSTTIVAAALGHKSAAGPRMTLVYSHLSADAGRPAVEAIPLDEILDGLSPTLKPKEIAAWVQRHEKRKEDATHTAPNRF